MKEFIEGLMKDSLIPNGVKLLMLKDYESRWFTHMCTTTQNSDQLKENNESLLVIQEAIKTLTN